MHEVRDRVIACPCVPLMAVVKVAGKLDDQDDRQDKERPDDQQRSGQPFHEPHGYFCQCWFGCRKLGYPDQALVPHAIRHACRMHSVARNKENPVERHHRVQSGELIMQHDCCTVEMVRLGAGVKTLPVEK
jgi:hypothetical protein